MPVSRNKVSGLKVSGGGFRDEIDPPAAILLPYDFLRGARINSPPSIKKTAPGGDFQSDVSILCLKQL